ncbi:MAG: valine--tRNA ligase [Candidatus Micrarchaeota archaeon]
MLAKNYSKEIEKKWQKKWEENKTYAFDEADAFGDWCPDPNWYLDPKFIAKSIYSNLSKQLKPSQSSQSSKPSKPIYSIDTPPPFTSGELHLGHVLSYSFFDFIARYKRMNGFNVFYPQGWDAQGFPTEVRVEKKHGKLPPDEFRKKCIEWTYEFIAKMKAQMIEMGFSPDWRYEYRTMDPEYHSKVQLSLIQMYNKGEIYRAEYPVHWCPNCVSAIAKAELEDLERETFLNYVIFRGADGEYGECGKWREHGKYAEDKEHKKHNEHDEYKEHEEQLIIATTRPELIPACVAVMFNPSDERYNHLKGSGKTAITPLGDCVPIIADKDVEKEFGTGLMMVCTFGDKMDVVWTHRHKLQFKNVIDQHGRMQNSGELNGLKIQEARKKILEKLNSEGKLLKQEKKLQVVKVHDRCKTLVEFITSMQWFGNIKASASRIKEFAKQITWVPSFGISYLTDWIDNVDWDWVISRQRFFGTPLPFYYCEKCNRTAAAEELPFYAEKAKRKMCLCGEEMKAETSTCDCWVDSSITPLIIAGWPNNKKAMERIYPSSLRSQGVEIVRTWAFYTIYRSGMLTGKKPWETILLNGNVLAPDGKKMSKSLDNVISPQQLQSEYSADAIRQWAALSGAMAKDRPFSYEDLRYAKGFLIKLWNSAKLIEINEDEHEDNVKKEPQPLPLSSLPASLSSLPPSSAMRVVDRWIIGRMNETIRDFTAHMEVFEYHHAMSKLYQFYWHDFCDNYLEYVKHRIYAPHNCGEQSKMAAQITMRSVLYNTIKLIAPITPHISEEIWYEVFKEKESIHRAQWPKVGLIDENAIALARTANEIVKILRQYKATNKKAMNSALSYVKMRAPDIAELKEDICGVMKIQRLEIENSEKVELVNAEFAACAN